MDIGTILGSVGGELEVDECLHRNDGDLAGSGKGQHPVEFFVTWGNAHEVNLTNPGQLCQLFTVDDDGFGQFEGLGADKEVNILGSARMTMETDSEPTDEGMGNPKLGEALGGFDGVEEDAGSNDLGESLKGDFHWESPIRAVAPLS